MSSMIEMSLEDIIQKKKEKLRNNKPQLKKIQSKKMVQQNQKINKQKQVQRGTIIDARNKIISKKRTQITDAREKLAELAKQKDARLKLEQLRLRKGGPIKGIQRNRKPDVHQDLVRKWTRNFQNREPVFTDPSRQIRSQPHLGNRMKPNIRNDHIKKFKETRSIETRRHDYRPLKPIVRTVANDIIVMDDDEDDPMGEDDVVPYKPMSMNRMASLNLKIVTHNRDARARLEERSSGMRSSTTLVREASPAKPPSILKKRPMAALRTEKKPEVKEAPAEYRIIVSNLRSSVTGGDIEELFGDVGGMVESRLVRPGTAEVIYKTQEDAQKAVDLYHNRQLDGQAMNCLLVAPRAAAANPRISIGSKPSLPASSHSNVEPDISTFHKVLFNTY